MRKTKQKIGLNDLRIVANVDWRDCVLVTWRWSDGQEYSEYLCPVSWFNDDHPLYDGNDFKLAEIVQLSIGLVLSAHFEHVSSGKSMGECLCNALGFPVDHQDSKAFLYGFGGLWERSVKSYRFGKSENWRMRYNPTYWTRKSALRSE